MKKIIRFLFIIFYILATYNFVSHQVKINSPVALISMIKKGKERKTFNTGFNSEDEFRDELKKSEDDVIFELQNKEELKNKELTRIKKLFLSKKLDRREQIEQLELHNEKIESLKQESFTPEHTPTSSGSHNPNSFSERLTRMKLGGNSPFKIRNKNNSGMIRSKEERLENLKPFMRMPENNDEKSP